MHIFKLKNPASKCYILYDSTPKGGGKAKSKSKTRETVKLWKL